MALADGVWIRSVWGSNMSTSNYLREEDVISAFTEFGGEADWTDIETHITQKRNHPYAPYKDLRNYKNTMFQIVQQHCEGVLRQAELKEICGRMPAVPSIVINERIAFDNIPDMEALSEAVKMNMNP